MRTLLLAMLLPAIALFPIGCASLDAQPDYEKARGLVSGHTGSGAVFDPHSTVDSASALVNGALADGVTLDEAIAVALLNNPGFQAQFLEIGISRTDLAQSQLLTNPTLSFSVGSPDIAGRSKLTGSLVQSLIELWQLPVRKHIAETQLERSIFRAANTAIELRADVKKRYFALLAVLEAQPKIEENIRLLQHSLDLAQRQFDAGDTGIQDVNLARAALLDGQGLVNELTRTKALAGTELARLMGVSRNAAGLHVNGTLPDALPLPLDMSELLLLAMQQRLDAQAASLNVRIAEQDLRKERRNRIPALSVGVEAERPDEAKETNAANSTESANSTEGSKQKVINLLVGPSIELTLPLFDQNQAQIKKTEIVIVQRRKELESLLDSVAAEVAEAMALFDAAKASVLLLRDESLPLAMKNADVARILYQAGEQSVFPLLYAQQALLAQERALVQARADFGAAYAELERSVGGNLMKPATTDPAEDTEKVKGQ